MIDSIELANWKTHRSTVLNFQKGVNVLIGVMGAGKSSVMDAISFGLFGTFPALRQRRVTVEDIIANRPSVQRESEVRLSFTVENDSYKVTRKISRDGISTAKLEKNGSYLQSQPTKVTEEIEHLLKVDYDTFARAVYSEQNRLDYFLELAKGDRKKQIDEMLGLDSFAKAEENTKSLINGIKSSLEEEEQFVAKQDFGALKKQLEKLASERQVLVEEQKSLIGKSKIMEARVRELKEKQKDYRQKNERKRLLSKEIAEQNSRLSTIKEELKKLGKIEISEEELVAEIASAEKRHKELEGKIKAARNEERSLTKELAGIQASIKSNADKIIVRDKILSSIRGKDIIEIEKSAKRCDAEKRELLEKLASLNARTNEMKKWVEELKKHISRCPVCERELEQSLKDRLLDEKDGAIKDMEREIERSLKVLKSVENKISELETEHRELKLATSKLAEYMNVERLAKEYKAEEAKISGKVKEGSGSVEALEKEREPLNSEINKLNASIDKIKRKRGYESEIEKISESVSEKSSEASKIDINEEQMYKLDEQLTKETASLSDITSKIESNERYTKNLDVQINEKGEQIAAISEMQDKIERKRSVILEMNKFKIALVETEKTLRSKLVTSINGLMQNIWLEIYPYADYSGIRLDAKTDDYTLEACTSPDSNNGKTWIDINSIASGGERSVASLTMRIALAMVIVPNLRWLILDEPTHNIDESGIDKMIEVLGDSLPKVVEQIFIITHDSNLKHISSARIYQLDRNKNSGEPTSISEL